MKKSKPELKPCPFCGNECTLWKDPKPGIVWYTVQCSADCAIGPWATFHNKRDAVNAWNTRNEK